MNTGALDKIHDAYNADHDLGPEAPIHWSVEELAQLVGKLIEEVEELHEQIAYLQDAVPSAKRHPS